MDAMAFLAGVMIVALVVIICIEIGARYFFHRPQVWTVEICEYLLFCIAFLGAPWLLKVGGHVNIDIFTSSFGSRGQRRWGLFSSATGVVVSLIICWTALRVAYENYHSGVVLTKTIEIPQYPFILLIALGYLLLMVEFLRQFLAHIKGIKEMN